MDERINVVAVCGNEARVYGLRRADGTRQFLWAGQFAHRGAAIQFAQEYEDQQRGAHLRNKREAA